MEGQIHKIRTMARDLERARLAEASTEPGTGRYLAERAKKLSDSEQKKEQARPEFRPAKTLRPVAPLGLLDKAEEKKEAPTLQPRASEIRVPTTENVEVEKERQVSQEKKAERRLSDILKGAREKMEEKRLPPRKLKTEAEGEVSVEDLLPIEPPPKAEGEPIEAKKPIPSAPQGTGLYPAPQPSREPPSNLPTEETILPPAKKTVEAEAESDSAEAMPKEELPPRPDERQSKTPEEILGLPTRIPPTTRFARPSATEAPKKQPREAEKTEKMAAPPPSPVPRRMVQDPVPEKTAKRRPPIFKFAAAIGVLGVILAVILGGLYWNFFIKKPPEPILPSAPLDGGEPPEIQRPIEQPKPESLLQYDEEHIIEIGGLSYSILKLEIDALQDVKYPVQSIVYIPIKYAAENEIRYLTLKEFFNTLRIDAPPSLLNYKDFTLFLYVQSLQVQEACVLAEIASDTCYGPRLGLAIKADDKEIILTAMQEWEKTIVNDLSPLILAGYETPEESAFKTGSYKNLETRYLNLPFRVSADQAVSVPTTSIDWILADDYLIIATSKDAARTAVDRLP